jgi:hypothetical protein
VNTIIAEERQPAEETPAPAAEPEPLQSQPTVRRISRAGSRRTPGCLGPGEDIIYNDVRQHIISTLPQIYKEGDVMPLMLASSTSLRLSLPWHAHQSLCDARWHRAQQNNSLPAADVIYTYGYAALRRRSDRMEWMAVAAGGAMSLSQLHHKTPNKNANPLRGCSL